MGLSIFSRMTILSYFLVVFVTESLNRMELQLEIYISLTTSKHRSSCTFETFVYLSIITLMQRPHLRQNTLYLYLFAFTIFNCWHFEFQSQFSPPQHLYKRFLLIAKLGVLLKMLKNWTELEL